VATVTYEEVLRLAEALTLDERLRLIADLAGGTRAAVREPDTRPRWMDLIGTAPYPALGEDTQAWVSRTRQESDDAREAQWQNRP
jgi:hypothetical protein